MTKTQVKELARARVAANHTALMIDFADVEQARTYDELQTRARAYAQTDVPVGVPEKLADFYRSEYVANLYDRWSQTLRQRENARRAFKRTCDGISVEEATTALVEIATTFNLRGARIDNGGVDIRRGPVSARVYWQTDWDANVVVNPDDARDSVSVYRFTFTYSTSGTTYTLAEMTVAAGVHADLVALGAELEAVARSMHVIRRTTVRATDVVETA